MLDRNTQLLGVEQKKARSVGATLKRLWAYFRSYRLALITVVLLVLAGTYMQVLIPDLTGQAVDCYLGPFAASQMGTEGDSPLPEIPAVETGKTATQDAFSNCWYTTPAVGASAEAVIAGLGALILLIVGLYLATTVVSGFQFYLMSWAGFHVLRDIRKTVFEHIHRLSMGYFSRNEAGDVMSRFTNDVDTLQQIIGFGLVRVLQGVLLLVSIVITMLSKNLLFALISLVTLPLMFLITRWLSAQARRAFRQARQEIGAVNADLQESIANVREVQAFSREDENIEQFMVQNAANRDANVRAQIFTSALPPMLEALSYASLAIVAVVGGVFILSDAQLGGSAISVGLIITFIAYTQQFNRPVQQIALLWTNIQSAVAGAERIFDLLDEHPDIQDKADAIELPQILGRVELVDIWAEYNPGEPVLSGINLTAEPGQTIAIVGPTGAGKTTIINLIPRFWDVLEGQLLIDGHDIREVTRQSLREQIGIVLQDTFLFSDTVMNNIRYGQPDASDEQVKAAAELAQADDFISLLPEGYETILGERGSGLSQGQRQLLAIARVALTDPRILILDEATSSVDTRTERKIQVALDKLLAGRTSFVIAHRLSTIRNADVVLVLDDGEIIERGTHRELLEARGFYFDLYMSQYRREVDEGEEEAGEGFLVVGD
jgi:ATP-binding cassette subfamily B protein